MPIRPWQVAFAIGSQLNVIDGGFGVHIQFEKIDPAVLASCITQTKKKTKIALPVYERRELMLPNTRLKVQVPVMTQGKNGTVKKCPTALSRFAYMYEIYSL